MEEYLLNIISLPSMEDTLVDWLLVQSEITGFSSIEINGHGAAVAGLSIAEQVEGRQKHVQFSIHTEKKIALNLIVRLKERFQGSGLHYYVLPLIEAGKV